MMQTIKAVASSFVGLRRADGMEQDMRLNPLHVVAAAFAGVALLVVGLVALVHWVA